MVVGALTVIIYKQLEGGIFDSYEIVPGFIAAWIAILVFSKIGTQNSEDVEEIFNEVQERLRKSNR